MSELQKVAARIQEAADARSAAAVGADRAAEVTA